MSDDVDLDLDLDDLAAEVQPRRVRVGGEVYTAPGDLRVDVARQLQKLASDLAGVEDDATADQAFELMESFLAAVFGDEQAPKLMRACTLEQLAELITGVCAWYGLDSPGKALGSSQPSNRAGRRSKPTSGGSTGSGSSTRASARSRSAAGSSRG